MEQCKNCGQDLTGNFCAHCGQKAKTKRIDAAYIVHDLPHGVFHVDKGFLYTMGQLLSKPGKAIAGYLAGRRIKHFNPFSYLIILGSLASLASHTANSLIRKRMAGHDTIASPGTSGLDHFIGRLTPFFDKYPSLLFLVMIPLASLVTWLYFRKRGYNYWENIVLNTYLTAQFNICLILVYLFVMLAGKTQYSFTPWLIIFFTYLSFAYGQFFSYGNKKLNPFVLAGLIILITFLYVTCFSFAGTMTPWWNF